MKALSLKQPFAELIVSGKKTIELRKWSTKFRGKFLIHASKVPDKKAMQKFGFKELVLGAIIGQAELVEIKKYENDVELERDNKKHLADKAYGKYGFILKNIKRLKPIYVKGQLGFWEFKK